MIILVTVLIVLAVLVAADRLTPRLVSVRIADTLQTALGTDQRPAVRLGGFPFLTQVATRHYQRISITARDVPVSQTGGRLSLSELDGTLVDVRPNRSYRTITVGRLTGSAMIDYSTLSEATGTLVGYASGNRDAGLITLTLGGAITVTGKPSIDPRTGDLYLSKPQFRVGGRPLPAAIADDLLNQVFRIPLPELITGVSLSGVRATQQGLVLTASGTDLTLER